MPDSPPESASIRAAREHGVDLSLMRANLRLTPTERLEKLQAAANVVLALRAAIRPSAARDDA